MAAYDSGFYDTIRSGTQRSAARLVPLLCDELGLDDGDKLIDVGCGEGWWAETFADHGLEVLGMDGAYVQSSPLGDRFIPHDLSEPLPPRLHGRFDVAVSLEVAEHLPPARASGFVDDLTALAPIVVFSAAIPGLGGTGHVIELWPSYWTELFVSHGYAVSGALRFVIWDDTDIENWYRQNLLIAVRSERIGEFPGLFDTPTYHPIPIVHPVLYDHIRPRRGR